MVSSTYKFCVNLSGVWAYLSPEQSNVEKEQMLEKKPIVYDCYESCYAIRLGCGEQGLGHVRKEDNTAIHNALLW